MNDISTKHSKGDYFKFIIPSLLGVLLFMIPFQVGGETTITVALIASMITDSLGDLLPIIVMIIVTVTVLLSLVYKLAKPAFFERNEFLKSMVDINWFWLSTKILAIILVFMVYFKAGPEWVWHEYTGGLILYDLLLNLVSIFFVAGLLLPLLTDFGLLEFVGSLLVKIMRPLFKIPGRSSIDCIASWVGDGTIGVTLTDKQYQDGYYSTQEASIVSTTFSAVSITFTLVVLSQVGLTNMFAQFYLAIIVAGVVAALIVPRVPPLSRKSEDYYQGNKKAAEDLPKEETPASWGKKLALKRARQNESFGGFIKSGIKTILNMWMGVIPVIMAFGTIAVIIAEYTPLFVWLGMPFIPILKVLQIPEAVAASQTMIVGFADMFLPSVIGASIESDITRFVIAGVSITQLIYLSEVGAVILGSKIPLSLTELFIIFIQRTLVTLPIIAIAGHLIF